MTKRLLDALLALTAFVATLPILLPIILLIYLEDRHSPFYVATRVGRNNRPFRMLKLRSMVPNAHLLGASSTSASDNRITRVGHFIRRYKIDELSQFWNVLVGDMSLVGPRPQVVSGVERYTDEEMRLLAVRPGITDFSSIVFSDEGDILAGANDPDLKYEQLIRPWKSRLGLVYVDNQSTLLDLKLLVLTALAIVNKQSALDHVETILRNLAVDEQLLLAASRKHKLEPYPPPGTNRVVETL